VRQTRVSLGSNGWEELGAAMLGRTSGRRHRGEAQRLASGPRREPLVAIWSPVAEGGRLPSQVVIGGHPTEVIRRRTLPTQSSRHRMPLAQPSHRPATGHRPPTPAKPGRWGKRPSLRFGFASAVGEGSHGSVIFYCSTSNMTPWASVFELSYWR
jgi:hypothetical protein